MLRRLAHERDREFRLHDAIEEEVPRRSPFLFGVVCLLAAPGAALTIAWILEVLNAPGLSLLSWTPITGLASPPFTLAAWLVFLLSSRRLSNSQAATGFVGCVAATAGSVMAWASMGLFIPPW